MLHLSKEQLEKSLQNNFTKEEVMKDLNITWNQLRYNLEKYKLKLKLPSNIKDERGKKYGKLTVIDFYNQKSKDNKVQWKCICDCGNEVIRVGSELRRNRYECMCDNCQKQKISKIQYKNHQGERHNKLLVLKETKRDEKTGNIYWLCQCDCGNQVEVISYRLNYNTPQEAKSCGCLESSGEYFINQILNEKDINYKSQYQFNDCYGSISKKQYKFDFAIFNKNNDLLFLIEYNGKQHYEPSQSGWNTKENVLQTQFRDNEKIMYCKNNNIPLFIIPYYYNTKLQIQNQIENYIIKNNFSV